MVYFTNVIFYSTKCSVSITIYNSFRIDPLLATPCLHSCRMFISFVSKIVAMERKVRIILIPLGLLTFISAYILTHYTSVSVDIIDFLRGFSLSVIIFALLFQAKWKQNS